VRFGKGVKGLGILSQRRRNYDCVASCEEFHDVLRLSARTLPRRVRSFIIVIAISKMLLDSADASSKHAEQRPLNKDISEDLTQLSDLNRQNVRRRFNLGVPETSPQHCLGFRCSRISDVAGLGMSETGVLASYNAFEQMPNPAFYSTAPPPRKTINCTGQTPKSVCTSRSCSVSEQGRVPQRFKCVGNRFRQEVHHYTPKRMSI